MRFFLRCPKCDSTNISIREARISMFGGSEKEFHCHMCGKVIYGAAKIEEEYNHQVQAFRARMEQDQKQRQAEEDAKREQALLEVKRKILTEKAKRAALATPKVVVQTPACAWKDCSNPSRKNSKYCSRDCSNKNARHRHRLRKQVEESGITPQAVMLFRGQRTIAS